MRYLALLLFAFGFMHQAEAQKEDMKPALITVTAGWSFADLNQGDQSTDRRSGFFAGVRKDIKLFPTLHLETGALYTQKGATFDLEGTDFEYKLDYIDIPAALKLKIGGFYGLAGVSGNIRVNSNIEGFEGEEPDVKPFELSSSVGLGFKLLMISIDFRWNHSLGDIVKDNEGDDIYNSYFLIGLGFNFHRR